MHTADKKIKLRRNANGVLKPERRSRHINFHKHYYLRESEEDQHLKSKEGIAFLIASGLNRASSKSDEKGMILLVAALSLLNMSDGQDQLMSVARRLAIKGSSLLGGSNVQRNS
jgi:hypothetical protein